LRSPEDAGYLVTEYIEGPALYSWVRSNGPMRGSTAEQLATAVASALAAIHRAGIVHRDLKPSLRNPVVGRKNYYGAQAEWAAHLAARFWTLTATAERNGHEPLAYLTSYLDACAAAGGKPPEGTALEQFFVWLPDPGDTTGGPDPAGADPPDGPAP
jgi:hypothetical protein